MISDKDKSRLRALAGKQSELANDEKNRQLYARWLAHGRGDINGGPMVRIELDTFEPEILPPRMQCEGDEARVIERRLLRAMVNRELFDDDTLVPDRYQVGDRVSFVPFGLPVNRQHTGGLGFHDIPHFEDMETGLTLIKPTICKEDIAGADMEAARADELFGDLLSVQRVGSVPAMSATAHMLNLMGMENMYIAMAEEPEQFKQMLDILIDDYIAHFKRLTEAGLLRSAAREEALYQGTYCFTDELPDGKVAAKLNELWLYMDSQECSGVSANMYRELVFPSFARLMNEFGLVSYGCCEAVHALWDDCLSKVPNLRKVSVSPWCDEEMMGERLHGSNVAYLRKPTPNLIGVGAELDEQATHDHIRRTAIAARGCLLEVIQRDVYTVNSDPQKVHRYVEIIRQELDAHWQA